VTDRLTHVKVTVAVDVVAWMETGCSRAAGWTQVGLALRSLDLSRPFLGHSRVAKGSPAQGQGHARLQLQLYGPLLALSIHLQEVMSIAGLLGMTPVQAQASVSSNPRAAALRGRARKLGGVRTGAAGVRVMAIAAAGEGGEGL